MISSAQPLAYVNGSHIPVADAHLAIHDAGIVSGATITDFCRTYNGRLFRREDHLARFRRDCEACFIPLSYSDAELTTAANELISQNLPLSPTGTELALITFATPGPIGAYAGRPGMNGPTTLVMHTFPLSFARYRPFFEQGISLAVVGHHSASESDLAPPRHKHRSRLHWWRADQLLRQRKDVPADAVALVLDGPDGHITETAIGNVLIVEKGIVYTPPRGTILDGISLRVCEEICVEQGIAFRERAMSVGDCQNAEEVMLTGTAFGLAGVCRLEGKTYTWPGEITRKLLQGWNARVGLDIAKQFLG